MKRTGDDTTMGMTRAFYYVVNTGFSKERVQEILSEMTSREMASLPPQAGQILKKLGGGERALELLEMLGKTVQIFGKDSIVAWREDARMFPVFDTNSCEGHTAVIMDNEVLAQYFQAPVLSFSVMDSDVMFVVYRDRENGEKVSCARPNYSGTDEEIYDTNLYKVEFPEPLLKYCGEGEQQKLRDIWESEDYTFAEDRMEAICELLGLDIVYVREDIPEGYEVVTAFA